MIIIRAVRIGNFNEIVYGVSSLLGNRAAQIVIDDHNAYEAFRYGSLLDVEVVGQPNSSFFGLLDDFELKEIPPLSKQALIDASRCEVFIPELSVSVSGGEEGTANRPIQTMKDKEKD